MKPKTMILMVVAVACGLGASYMTSRLLADRSANVERVTILVARKPLNRGDMIKVPEELFEEKQFPRGDEPKMAIAEFEKLKGQQLKRPLRIGDFVTPEDLRDDNAPAMDTMLPAGHQAIGIRVSPEKIAGGFASLPNSRVNIISTVRRGSDRETYAKLLLENVLVLAADQNMQIGADGKAMPANVVTVALKPDEVLKLEVAQARGTISLALRKLGDNTRSDVSKVDAEGLPGHDSSFDPTQELVLPKPAPVVQKEQPPPANIPKEDLEKHVMTIIEGDKERQVTFWIDRKTGQPVRTEARPGGSVSTPRSKDVSPSNSGN